MLAADTDTLTKPDFLSRATWADAWRGAGHRETASWHFVDLELDGPDLKSACFGFPSPASPPSAGPAQDCIVDKLDEFEAELAAPTTPQPERILAFKYVLHFVGDIHQPLHASDNHDRGGNCVTLTLGGSRTVNLHSYWDTGVLASLGSDPVAAAKMLEAEITPAERQAWSSGAPAAWAQESWQVAKAVAHPANAPAGCDGDKAPVTPTADYQAKSEAAARVQLEKAGVRLAWYLNTAAAGTSGAAQGH